MNARLRGRGVDINPRLVKESNQRAAREGLADRVTFEHRNAFDVDLREATVVTMWLFPELMRLLRPVILERARPGTRVLTSTWTLGSWQPDHVNNDGVPIYMWIVPARVAGRLRELATHHGAPGPAGVRLRVPLTQDELARMVGASREAVNRSMGALAARGLVRSSGRRLFITDPDALERHGSHG
jgi:hypothetical protein